MRTYIDKIKIDTAKLVAESITQQLESGKQVLFFVSGGSTIVVEVEISKILRETPHENLTIMPTDERYGLVGHTDSNWHQLIKTGFSLPKARLVPILTGMDARSTTQRFNDVLEQELKKDSYKIGLFGIGADGHTAGILPNSQAVNSTDLAYTYKTEKFERITITPKMIRELNEAIVYALGKDKWKTLKELETNKNIHEQPAQILKVVPLLKIFTDYNKN